MVNEQNTKKIKLQMSKITTQKKRNSLVMGITQCFTLTGCPFTLKRISYHQMKSTRYSIETTKRYITLCV